MDVHLRELRYFVAVAEELHFTRAAERLFVSQPALSKQIRMLERQLGFELFARDARGVALTAQGRALLPTARAVLAAWEEGLETTRAAGAAGVLVVGMQTAVGRGLQRQAIERFQQEFPDWDVSLRLVGWEDPTAGLADGSSDVAFLWLPAAEDLSTYVIASERRWVALPSEHPLASRREVPFADLRNERFIALPVPAGPLRDFWLATDERDGQEPRIATEATSPDEVFETIASGLGVALLAEGNVELYQRAGVTCRPVSGLAPARLAIAWRPKDRRSAVAAFVAAIRRGDAPA